MRFAVQPFSKLDATAVDELDVDDANGERAEPHTLSRFSTRQCHGHLEPSLLKGELNGTRGNFALNHDKHTDAHIVRTAAGNAMLSATRGPRGLLRRSSAR
jgi:hypothetical protein